MSDQNNSNHPRPIPPLPIPPYNQVSDVFSRLVQYIYIYIYILKNYSFYLYMLFNNNIVEIEKII